MTPEQQAAIERLRIDDYSDCASSVAVVSTCYEDMKTLCLMCLAEHRADDNEPTTGEWLRSVGASRDDSLSDNWTIIQDDGPPIGFWKVDDGWKAVLILSQHASSNLVRRQNTRGDVRRLCSALRITLNEEGGRR